MDDDELDIELRSPAEAAARCIVLAALIRRLSIEALAESESESESNDGFVGEAFDVRSWLQTEGLWERLAETEAAFIDGPVGQLDDDQLATVAWQTEGFATLGWALGLSELPPVGDLSHVETVMNSVPSPWDQTAPWIGAALLRPEPEIARERDRAEIIEWRVGIEAPRRAASGQKLTEYLQAIADVAREARAAGLSETIRDSDLLIGDRSITTCDDEDLERLAALAEERLRALNWLCGFGDSWDRVPLDV